MRAPTGDSSGRGAQRLVASPIVSNGAQRAKLPFWRRVEPWMLSAFAGFALGAGIVVAFWPGAEWTDVALGGLAAISALVSVFMYRATRLDSPESIRQTAEAVYALIAPRLDALNPNPTEHSASGCEHGQFTFKVGNRVVLTVSSRTGDCVNPHRQGDPTQSDPTGSP